jgi:endonuclease/exonuclease/phosphatase (EEP) superfamily protein YafD
MYQRPKGSLSFSGLAEAAGFMAAVGSPIRAMVINVDTYHGNPDAVIAAICKENPDLVVLEEIDLTWKRKVEEALDRLPFRIAEPQSDNFGIMALSRIPWRTAEIVFLGQSGVPSVSAIFDTANGPFTLIATHPEPPAGSRRTAFRNEQLERVAEYVNGVNMPVLLLGDLNCTPWCPAFNRLTAATGLRDGSKGRGIHATWPSFAGRWGLPLDHALYGPGIQMLDVRVGESVGSDHLPLIVDFAVGVEPDPPKIIENALFSDLEGRFPRRPLDVYQRTFISETGARPLRVCKREPRVAREEAVPDPS